MRRFHCLPRIYGALWIQNAATGRASNPCELDSSFTIRSAADRRLSLDDLLNRCAAQRSTSTGSSDALATQIGASAFDAIDGQARDVTPRRTPYGRLSVHKAYTSLPQAPRLRCSLCENHVSSVLYAKSEGCGRPGHPEIAHEAGRGSRPRSGKVVVLDERQRGEPVPRRKTCLSVRVHTNNMRGKHCRHPAAAAVGPRCRRRRHEDRQVIYEILFPYTPYLRDPLRPAGEETIPRDAATNPFSANAKFRPTYPSSLAPRTADGRGDYAGTRRGRDEAPPRRFFEVRMLSSMPSPSPDAASSWTSHLQYTQLDESTNLRIFVVSRSTFPGSGSGVAKPGYDDKVLHTTPSLLIEGARTGASLESPVKSSPPPPPPRLINTSSTLSAARRRRAFAAWRRGKSARYEEGRGMSKSRLPSTSGGSRTESQREGERDVGDVFGARPRTIYEDRRGEARRDEMRRRARRATENRGGRSCATG
ncbi:hypothetical protein EV121DRAFT_284835 [Schizophyllum commune]